jgi:hypothetical protein
MAKRKASGAVKGQKTGKKRSSRKKKTRRPEHDAHGVNAIFVGETRPWPSSETSRGDEDASSELDLANSGNAGEDNGEHLADGENAQAEVEVEIDSDYCGFAPNERRRSSKRVHVRRAASADTDLNHDLLQLARASAAPTDPAAAVVSSINNALRSLGKRKDSLHPKEQQEELPRDTDAHFSPVTLDHDSSSSSNLFLVDSTISTNELSPIPSTPPPQPSRRRKTKTKPMAPPPSTRVRSVPKSGFSHYFARLKTSTYNDRPASHAASSSHAIRTLSWNALGTLIATGAGDRTLRVWNPEKPHVKSSTELRGHAGAVERVVFRPNHESELASCGSDGTVRVWDVRRKEQVGEVKVGNEALFLTWRPDGQEILVGTKV